MPVRDSLRVTWKYIVRGGWGGLTPVLVMTLTFFITSVFISTLVGSKFLLDYLESKAQVIAFFDDSVGESDILTLKKSLEDNERVEDVVYVSKEDALQIYLGQHKNEPGLLESISANVFPASLEIRAKEIDDLPLVAEFLEDYEGIEEVVFYGDVIDTFRRWSNNIRLFGGVFVGILGAISILIVLVTIGISIHQRGEEVEIMKLIGATDWYIRRPFVFQGMFYGLLSGLLSSLLLIALVPILIPKFEALLKGIPLPSIQVIHIIVLLAGQLMFGVLLGIGGSLGAIRKYLRN